MAAPQDATNNSTSRQSIDASRIGENVEIFQTAPQQKRQAPMVQQQRLF